MSFLEIGGYSSARSTSAERLVAPGSSAASTNRLTKLFGTGVDGNVTIVTDTWISRDTHYNNLTVNSGVTLFTNGFKIFVRGTLTNNGTIGMPQTRESTTAVLAGAVITRDDGTAGYTTTRAVAGTLGTAVLKDIESMMSGSYSDGSTVSRFYVGEKGTAGTANPGNPGSGGGSTDGNPGTAGSAGKAGGAVVVLADTITGTGNFVSSGTPGSSGTSGNPGSSAVGNVSHNPSGHTSHGHGHCNNPSNCGAHHARPDNPNHCHYHHPASGCNPAPHHNHPGNSHHNPSYPGGTGGTGNPGNPGAEGALLVGARTLGIDVTMSNTTYRAIADL